MLNQLTADEQALRLFFTDDIYLVPEKSIQHLAGAEAETAAGAEAAPATEPVRQMPPPQAIKEEAPVFKFLGQNKRNILILVNDPGNEVSGERGRELLRKIVKSVNLSAADFALLNYAGYMGISFAQLQHHFSSAIVFAFGVSPVHLGLSEQPENTVVTEGTVKVIFSAELGKLDEDQYAKKVLWGSLKQLGI